jgi:CheY-like chemotaxis protein
MMGGRIWIESELGKGASFVFTVKAKRAGEKQKMIPDWGKVRILAVDDDPYTLEYFEEIIEGFGATCDIATSAEKALQLIVRNGVYDIYFVDWKMPGIDGIELTGTITARDMGYGKPHVVMMSVDEWSTIEAEARKAGADGFLPKPLFPSAIADIINDCLGVDRRQVEDAHHDMPSFAGRRILLAEDVEINREIVIALLEPTRLVIECAENGEEAVRMFRESPQGYDMVFMDVQMPGMDGFEATRRIRAMDAPNAKGIPIIAMTANVFKEDIEKCIESGMDGHIGKPLNLDDIINILGTYIR